MRSGALHDSNVIAQSAKTTEGALTYTLSLYRILRTMILIPLVYAFSVIQSHAWPSGLSSSLHLPRQSNVRDAEQVPMGADGERKYNEARANETLAVNAARSAREQGNVAGAIAALKAFHLTHLDNTYHLVLLSDLLIGENRLQEAYDTVAPYCTQGAFQQVLLRGALVSAMKGEVYLGEKEFLMQVLRRRYDPKDLSDAFGGAEGKPNMATLACAALASDSIATGDKLNTGMYCSRLDTLDPRNPIAAEGLSELACNEGHYVVALRIVDAAIPRCSGEMLRYLSVFRAQTDRLLSLYGDGVKPRKPSTTPPP